MPVFIELSYREGLLVPDEWVGDAIQVFLNSKKVKRDSYDDYTFHPVDKDHTEFIVLHKPFVVTQATVPVDSPEETVDSSETSVNINTTNI